MGARRHVWGVYSEIHALGPFLALMMGNLLPELTKKPIRIDQLCYSIIFNWLRISKIYDSQGSPLSKIINSSNVSSCPHLLSLCFVATRKIDESSHKEKHIHLKNVPSFGFCCEGSEWQHRNPLLLIGIIGSLPMIGIFCVYFAWFLFL